MYLWLLVARNTVESILGRFVRDTTGPIVRGRRCLLWTGHTMPSGHGRVSLNGHDMYTHRFMYEYTHGSVPEGLFVLHHCDVPQCGEVRHLYAGTQPNNVQDMIDRNRNVVPRSSQHGRTVLTERMVLRIRILHERTGIGATELSRITGIPSSTIYRIIRRFSWTHI